MQLYDQAGAPVRVPGDNQRVLCARIGHVGVRAIGPAGFPLCEALPMLTPFGVSAVEASWRISVIPSAGPADLDGFSAAQGIALFPETAVKVRSHPRGDVWYESGGTSALVEPVWRQATLYIPRPDHADAPRLSALALVEILRQERIYLVHAAAVATKDAAILIVGSSGAGKSTLACALASGNAVRLMADDRCLLWRQGADIVCQGVALPVGLCRESERILSRLGHRFSGCRPAASREDKTLYDAAAEFGPLERGWKPVRTIVLLTPAGALAAIPPAKALDALLRGGLYVGHARVMEDHFGLLSDLVGKASLLAAPSRPAYPQIVRSLLEAVGCGPSEPRLRENRPHPEIGAAQAAGLARWIAETIRDGTIPAPLRPCGEAEWRPLLKLAEYHGLLATLGFAAPGEDIANRLPEGLGHVLKTAVAGAEASRLLHLDMVRRIGRELNGAAIPWCAMKGPAIAERFFHPAAARPYGDLDIIVPVDQREHAAQVVRGLGFEDSALNHILKNSHNRGEWVLVAHEPARYTVELHWDYVTGGSLRRFVSCDLAKTLARRVIVRVEGVDIPMTSPADQFVGCCVHAVYGHRMGSLRHLLDVRVAWDHCSPDERRSALEIAAELGVPSAVQTALKQAEAIFPESRPVSGQRRPAFGIRAALAGFCMPLDATVRSWTPLNRFRGRVLRVMVRKRLV